MNFVKAAKYTALTITVLGCIVHGAPTPPQVPFLLNRAPFLDIINDLALKKGAILIPPQGAADLEVLKAQRVSYTPLVGDTIPLKQAWELTTTFLELSGFSLIQKNDRTYAVVRNSAIEGGSANRDILPLYIDPQYEELMQTDSRIRALIYLRSFKVPTLQEKENHPLSKLIKELSSKDVSYIYEPRSNAVLITDRAAHIASILQIIKQFDARAMTEEVAYIPLSYVKAIDVEHIFDTLKKASPEGEPTKFIGSDTVSESSAYFSHDTSVLADRARNGIILMGRSSDLERVTDFITDFLDVPQENGNSILHSYDLQYLDAVTFAPALQKIVSSVISSGQASQIPVRRGQEHFFKGVQIMAEGSVELKIEKQAEWPTVDQKGFPEGVGIEGTKFLGSNRLIIAARQDDWRIIKPFIEKLDQPNLQVILEIMIVDFSYDHLTTVASTIRSKTDTPLLPNGVEFLSSQISPVTSVLGNNPTQLAQDLLAVVGPDNVASTLNSGSLLISLNDPTTPGIFGLIQILEQVLKTKINSYPYLMISNNQKGSIETEQLRRTTGDLVTTQHGTYTIPIVDISATIKVVATPHIVSEDRVRLDIGFIIDRFEGNTFNRITQGLKTTATLASGQILAMGGVIRTDRKDRKTQTPFLGSIPILGAFFRGTTEETIRSNLTLFVSPTIIEPRNSKGLTAKTHEKICQAREGTEPLDNMRDPIVHLFLKAPPDSTFNGYFPTTTNLSGMREDSCERFSNDVNRIDLKQLRDEESSMRSGRYTARSKPFIHPAPTETDIAQQALPGLPRIKIASVSDRINKKAALPSWAQSHNSMDRLKALLEDYEGPFFRL